MNRIELIMRWSNGVNFAIPFMVEQPDDVVNGLVEFRKQCDDNAHLHVFIPSGKMGTWSNPENGQHIIAPGGVNKHAVVTHEQFIRNDGLISEAIRLFSPENLAHIIERAKKTVMTWGTSDNDTKTLFPPACVEYAMRDSLVVLRDDLVSNIRRASNDDLIPMPSEENNPVILRDLAYKYGLRIDFDRAYPEKGGGGE